MDKDTIKQIGSIQQNWYNLPIKYLEVFYTMDKVLMQFLKQIATAAKSIDNAVTQIIGWEMGGAYAQWENEQESHTDYQSSTPALQLNQESNGFGNQQEIKSTDEIIKEIKQMIIELKIKGSVRERPNGLIEYRSGLLGSIYGRTKEEIERQITKKLKEVKANKKAITSATKNKTPLLSEFFNSEYLPYKKQTLAISSIDSIIKDENFITGKGKFNKPLDKYTTQNIEEFLFTIPQTRKRQKVRGVLNNILTYAKRMGLIKTNPCEDVEKVKHEQKIGKAFSFQEQRLFFDNLFADSNIEINHKLYFVFVYLTGTRLSEALGIKTNDVDFENNTLHIQGTKTKGSNRIIPLFPLVKKALECMVSVNEAYFTISEELADKIVRDITQRNHKLHDLRHTFGTIKICVEKLDAKTVSLYMGHTTTTMTLTRYTHPEQLDKGLFFNGSLSEDEKLASLRIQYDGIKQKISNFLSEHTQNIPKK